MSVCTGTQVWSKIKVMVPPAAIKWLAFKQPTIDFYAADLHTSGFQCKSSSQNSIPGGWIPDRWIAAGGNHHFNLATNLGTFLGEMVAARREKMEGW